MICGLNSNVITISVIMIVALLSTLLTSHYNKINAVNNTSFSSSAIKFFFHLKNKHIFNNVMIVVRGEKGQSNAWRLVLFISNNIQRDSIPGFFNIGEGITACIINYSKNSYRNCALSTVTAAHEAHFYLTAAPS